MGIISCSGSKGEVSFRGKRKKLGDDMVVKDHAAGGEVVDLLDASMVRHLRLDEGGKINRRRKREEIGGSDSSSDDGDGKDEVRFNAQGKLVIHETKEDEASKVKARLAEIEKQLKEDEDDDEDIIRTGPKRKKLRGVDGGPHGNSQHAKKKTRMGQQVRRLRRDRR